jgi:hypothetical protein
MHLRKGRDTRRIRLQKGLLTERRRVQLRLLRRARRLRGTEKKGQTVPLTRRAIERRKGGKMRKRSAASASCPSLRIPMTLWVCWRAGTACMMRASTLGTPAARARGFPPAALCAAAASTDFSEPNSATRYKVQENYIVM